MIYTIIGSIIKLQVKIEYRRASCMLIANPVSFNEARETLIIIVSRVFYLGYYCTHRELED